MKFKINWRVSAPMLAIAAMSGSGLLMTRSLNWFSAIIILLLAVLLMAATSAHGQNVPAATTKPEINTNDTDLAPSIESDSDGVSVPGSKFKRHPQSVPGDFYVVNGMCLSCGAAHVVAPDLLGWVDEDLRHCIWIKQPSTAEEFEQAFNAFDATEAECYRYAGQDPAVIARLGPKFCDRA